MVRRVGNPGYVLAYHGCDRELGEEVLAGEKGLTPSRNAFDWLGHGIYFWESDWIRAEEWAVERMKHPNSKIKEPFVIGAIVDLGVNLSLMRREDIELVRNGFKALTKLHEINGEPLPQNQGGKDRFRRELDCGVIQIAHAIRKAKGEPEFDTVRGMFYEGEEVYRSSGFRSKNHVQICVRKPECIHGYFRVLEMRG